LDLLPIDEGSFLPPKGIKPKTLTRTNPQTTGGLKHSKPYTRKLWINPITAGDRRPYPIGLPQQRKGDCNL
jgi:hypothetical protein